ncbi:MAG: hypothetical protein AAFW70_13420 [Cyanobacteria bacterium J06635_10]
MKKNDFLYSSSSYEEGFDKNLVFNANLQEFSQTISDIANLQTWGKISSFEAYLKVKAAYKHLKRSKKVLGIGKNNYQQNS